MTQTRSRYPLFFLLASYCVLFTSSAMAYPVAVSLNLSFSGNDPLHLGGSTGTLTTTLESATAIPGATSASYPATIALNVPSRNLVNASFSGTLTIASSGQLSGTFSDSENPPDTVSFSLIVAGVTFPGPVPFAFGTANIGAGSTVNYTVIGTSGTVGVSGTISALGLTASPTSAITRTYQSGGSNPASATISVGSNNPATPSLNFVASVQGAAGGSTNFLSLSPGSGTTPGTVTVAFSTTVAAGTYTASILINTAGSTTGAISIPVTYTVSGGGGPPPSGFAANPSSLAFTFQLNGSTPATQTLALTSTTSTQHTFTISSDPFITVTASAMTTPATLTVGVNPAGLTAGAHSGAIQITSTSASITIPVTLTVTAGPPPPALKVTPSGNLIFMFSQVGNYSQTQALMIDVTGLTEYYSVTVVTGSFLSVVAATGQTPGTAYITANTNGLAAGSYMGSIQVTATNFPPITIPVYMNVGPIPTATLTAAPIALIFNYTEGQPAPVAQTVTLTSSQQTTFFVSSISPFLTVTPTNGTATGTFDVSLNVSGLNPGDYSDVLIVSTPLGLSASIAVTVHVTAAPISSITAAPTSLAFTSPPPSGSSLTQQVSLTGTSGTKFTAVSETPWLTVTPGLGTVPGTLTVVANPGGLAPGNYTGSVVIVPADSSIASITFPVTLNVTQPSTTQLSVSPSALEFTFIENTPAPSAQTVLLGALPGNTTYTLSTLGLSWITASLSADGTYLSVMVDPSGLAAGVHSGTVRVSAGASSVLLPVTLTVSATPAIGVSPAELTFNVQLGAEAPAAQNVVYTVFSEAPDRAASDSPWLNAIILPALPGTVFVAVDPGGLTPGTYQGNVTVSSPGTPPITAANIPVTLNISTSATPALTIVTNGISYQSQIGAPGLFVSLWGTGLGPVTPAYPQTTATGIGTNAGGTQVLVDGSPCTILFASAKQVNAILPFSISGKTATQIAVEYQGATSNTFSMPVQTAAPAIFSADASGAGGGAILNQDLSLNTASNPAPAGSIVAIYAGGAGVMTPSPADGSFIPIQPPFPVPTNPATVTIGGQTAPIAYYGAAPGLVAGVIQLNVTVPAGVASGPQPVVMTIGSTSSQPNLNVFVK